MSKKHRKRRRSKNNKSVILDNKFIVEKDIPAQKENVFEFDKAIEESDIKPIYSASLDDVKNVIDNLFESISEEDFYFTNDEVEETKEDEVSNDNVIEEEKEENLVADNEFIFENLEAKENITPENNEEDSNEKELNYLGVKLENIELNENKDRLKYFAIATLSFAILSIILFFVSVNYKSGVKVRIKEKYGVNYKINLKDNKLYNKKTLDKNNKVVASLIDNIDLKINYKFKSNKKFNYTYTYFIKSYLYSKKDEDSSLSKTEILTSRNLVSKNNSNSFMINEKINIDYAKYLDLYKLSFSNEENGMLEIALFVEIKDETGKVIKNIENKSSSIKIPISKTDDEIKLIGNNYQKNSKASIYKAINVSNTIILTLSALCVLITVVLLIKTIDIFAFIKYKNIDK